MLTRALRSALVLWSNFWFTHQNMAGTSCFRLAFGLTACLLYGVRAFDLTYLYTEDGLLPFSDSLWSYFDLSNKNGIYWGQFLQDYSTITLLHSVLLLLFLALAFGYLNRLLTFVLLLLHLSFFQRNPFVANGPEFITSSFLFSLCLIDCRHHRGISPLKLLKGDVQSSEGDILSTVGLRFIQIQVCIIYGYAGFEKLRSTAWWNGEALWNTLAYSESNWLNLEFLHHFPIAVVIATYVAVLWEVYFPALVWFEKTRKATLLFGILLHLGIAACMNLWFFSLVMCSSYFLWWEGPETKSPQQT